MCKSLIQKILQIAHFVCVCVWTLTWESGLPNDGRLSTSVAMMIKRKRAKRRKEEEAILDAEVWQK